MITALQLIFSPFETWEKVATAQRGFWWVLGVYLLPMLLISLGVEGFLLNQFGERRGELGMTVKVPVDLVMRYSVAYLVFLLVGILLSTKFLSLASDSFNVHASYAQSFVLMAYGFGPIILTRMLDGIPQINTWVCWALGVAGAVSVLYHGTGMILRPEQTKGFGLYLVTVVITVLVSAVVHFAALSVLHGRTWPGHATAGLEPVSLTVASLSQ